MSSLNTYLNNALQTNDRRRLSQSSVLQNRTLRWRKTRVLCSHTDSPRMYLFDWVSANPL
ncbi:hypothetical protein G9C98_001255 [Cotesia typhae]|uniref:Uncharacterized protein n=1 Tax=Cotesia typhae TaxID=2053667 RepID=A0A8J5UVW8_9HYME|nr:hypothetical protein G9C98_001255 [Cotesia typhae]